MAHPRSGSNASLSLSRKTPILLAVADQPFLD